MIDMLWFAQFSSWSTQMIITQNTHRAASYKASPTSSVVITFALTCEWDHLGLFSSLFAPLYFQKVNFIPFRSVFYVASIRVKG